MNTRNILVSFAIAGAAGALLGILFAPSKGSDARKRIARMGASFVDKGASRPVTYAGGGGGGFAAFKDSALDWDDMGEATVFSRSMMDQP